MEEDPDFKRPKKSDPQKSLRFLAMVSITTACTAEIITYPLGTLRTRLAVQDYKSPYLKYNGMISAYNSIIKEEGARVLYKGLTTSLLKFAIQSTTRVLVYGSLNQQSESGSTTYLKILTLSLCSNFIGTCLTNPLEVIRTRLQADYSFNARINKGTIDSDYLRKTASKETEVYKNGFDAYSKIISKEGYLAL